MIEDMDGILKKLLAATPIIIIIIIINHNLGVN